MVNLEDFFSQKILCRDRRAFFFLGYQVVKLSHKKNKAGTKPSYSFFFVPMMQVCLARFFFISIL
jgi:hypothetical protein